jgi:hypothetical protein
VSFRLTTRPGHPTFVDLPWEDPLEVWDDARLVSPVRGISRHVVRFVAFGDAMYALKEEPERVAQGEYRLLRDLEEGGAPVVEAVGVASGRVSEEGEPLDAILITRHLEFSLPYRALFASYSIHEVSAPLLDALAQLFVRLHLLGFFWGDCSLSNTLFRRDAGDLTAFLVDAETGQLHPGLSRGQRTHDLMIAEENVAGELLDLVAAGKIDPDVDPVLIAEDLVRRYEGLWGEVTREEDIDVNEQFRIADRIRRLNELGFDVAEMELVDAGDQCTLRMQTRVVEPGHHRRRMQSLTGLEAGENQARVILNDILRFRACLEQQGKRPVSEAVGAVRWMVEVFEPQLASVPAELGSKLDPVELYCQTLEHRWLMSERAGKDVGAQVAVADYVERVLPFLPDERQVFQGPPTQPVPIIEA